MRSLEHPDLVRRLNYLGDAVGGPAHLVDLDPDGLIELACATTGLHDLGEQDWPGWTETYRTLVAAVDREAQLHLLGRVLTRAEILKSLRTWLRLQDRWKSVPALTAAAVEEPVFVVGPPRTGTTILLELLALDPQLRAPIAYEALHPLADEASVERRRQLSEGEQELWADIHPPFMAMHELASDLPCECVHFLMYDFAGPHWGMLYDAPSYSGYLLEHPESLTRVYRLHRRMLQTFQHEAPGARPRRWLLKSPFHVASLPQLFAEYPDARVIHTHRDPEKFLASLVSILSAVRFMRSDAVDVAALAGIMEMTYQLFLEGAMAARQDGSVPAGQIVDSHFVDLMADPVSALRRLYEQLAIDWPDGHDQVIKQYLAGKPRGKHGVHSYSLPDVGLDPGSVRRTFASYVDHYGIAREG